MTASHENRTPDGKTEKSSCVRCHRIRLIVKDGICVVCASVMAHNKYVIEHNMKVVRRQLERLGR